jgi:tetratricopeptide (TPR) repeat protein
MSRNRLLRAALASCTLIFLSAHAAPKDPNDISRLMIAGKYSEALSRIDAALAKKPDDPRLRFSKGMLLAQQNQATEAIAVLLKLAEDFPDLPEPYNNLAVLYAANGQYESARIALDKAVATNPAYVTAHENLGDVYTELARQAYEKAAKLDSSNTMARFKAVKLQKGNQTQVQPAVPKDSLIPVTSRTAVPGKSGAGDVSERAAGNAHQAKVLAVVAAWAQAWSARNVPAYLSFYSNDFSVPYGISREAWVKERTVRIQGKKHISVSIQMPEVRFDGDMAAVRFRQQFSSDKLNATDWKTLILVLQNDNWRIREERTGG